MPKTQRYILLLLFAVLLASCKQKTVTQHDAQNDSVRKYLDLADTDTIPYHDKVKYNDKAYSLINLKRNDSVTRYFLADNIFNDKVLTQTEKILTKAKTLERLSISARDEVNKGRALKFYGLYYMLKSDNIKAMTYYFKAAKILKNIDKYRYYNVMLDLAHVQFYANDYQSSINTSLKMIKEISKINIKDKPRFLFLFTENIADNLFSLKQYNQSLSYCKKLELFEVKEKGNLLFASNYIELNDVKMANIYLDKLLKDQQIINTNPKSYFYAVSLKMLCNINYIESKVLIKNLLNVEKNLFNLNDVDCRNQNFKNLSICYAKAKDTLNAIQAAKKAVALSKEYKNPNEILNCLTQLIKVDKYNAASHMKEYVRINDSMQIAERRFRDKFARIQFETDEITQQKDQAIQRSWYVFGGLVVVLLIGILFLVLYYQRNKQKELVYQSNQEQANQEIYQLMLSQQAKEEEARQSEKKRIAQELQEGVMSKLETTRRNLEMLKEEQQPEIIQKAQPFIDGIQAIEEEIKTIAQGLNSQMFQERNSFTRVLQDFVAQQNQLQQAQYSLEIDSNIDWNTVSEAIKMNLYRIIQEASANTNKFAEAQHVIIRFVKNQNNLYFSVFDDGKGFDPELAHNGIGIKNMKQRMTQLNGKLFILSTIGKNTMISGEVPMS
jgi:signal transduction histidine kinase